MSNLQRTPSKSSRKSSAAPRSKPVTGPKAQKDDGRDALMARIEAVRMAQRKEGHFDCFAKANQGYCDQGDCLYRSDCLSFSKQIN